MAEVVASPGVRAHLDSRSARSCRGPPILGLMALLTVYFVGAEQGATSVISGRYVHEFVHDARHLLGFPCH